ncbi:hypothetical protein BVRB_029190 [Beta vulgaris subsp. vulgaris]|uniref:Uncharacterized protein n=1 Tax=Beta vulgaris subsp. vulgaris TaxID=3555 RepID=A0A0J8AXV6_BETVV|nr:hypothetical protein BVRB_029190 [Beta vulgaris subsp. vulgaris]
MLKNEKPDTLDELQDFRTRQIRYGLRVHEAIARSMELLPLPLKLYPGIAYTSFLVIILVIGLIIMFAFIGAITALIEREPQRIQDGLLRLHRIWNRAKVTVFQAEWDKNKVSVSTYPLAKLTHGVSKRSI